MDCQCITASYPTQISKIVPHSGTARYLLHIAFISIYSLCMNTLLAECGKRIVATTLKINVVHVGENEFYTTVCRSQALEELLIAWRWAGVKEESTSIQHSIRVPLSFARLSISAVNITE